MRGVVFGLVLGIASLFLLAQADRHGEVDATPVPSPPSVKVVEGDFDIEPMSEEEFAELQRQLREYSMRREPARDLTGEEADETQRLILRRLSRWSNVPERQIGGPDRSPRDMQIDRVFELPDRLNDLWGVHDAIIAELEQRVVALELRAEQSHSVPQKGAQ